MCPLLLDGLEVTTSRLSQRQGDAAACDLLAVVTPTTSTSELVHIMEEIGYLRISGLRLSGVFDLSVVRKFPSLRYLEVATDKPVDPRPLQCLDNLRGLLLCKPAAGLDFASFPKLETFVGDWHVENIAVRQRTLRELHLSTFNPNEADLTVLTELHGLANLSIVRTGIRSLKGIEGLEDLRSLDVAYAPKLASLDGLAAAAHSVRELSFDHAKAIAAYSPISHLRYLRRLKLSACAAAPDLRWARTLPRLEFFSFVDTNIIDGDLSPLLSLESLAYVGTNDKRHYTHSMAELNDALQKRPTRT